MTLNVSKRKTVTRGSATLLPGFRKKKKEKRKNIDTYTYISCLRAERKGEKFRRADDHMFRRKDCAVLRFVFFDGKTGMCFRSRQIPGTVSTIFADEERNTGACGKRNLCDSRRSLWRRYVNKKTRQRLDTYNLSVCARVAPAKSSEHWLVLTTQHP